MKYVRWLCKLFNHGPTLARKINEMEILSIYPQALDIWIIGHCIKGVGDWRRKRSSPVHSLAIPIFSLLIVTFKSPQYDTGQVTAPISVEVAG